MWLLGSSDGPEDSGNGASGTATRAPEWARIRAKARPPGSRSGGTPQGSRSRQEPPARNGPRGSSPERRRRYLDDVHDQDVARRAPRTAIGPVSGWPFMGPRAAASGSWTRPCSSRPRRRACRGRACRRAPPPGAVGSRCSICSAMGGVERRVSDMQVLERRVDRTRHALAGASVSYRRGISSSCGSTRRRSTREPSSARVWSWPPSRSAERAAVGRVEGALAPRGPSPPRLASAGFRRSQRVARARGPPAGADTHLRARHSPHPDAGEHPRAAAECYEARRWTRRVSNRLAGKTLGTSWGSAPSARRWRGRPRRSRPAP